GAACGRADQPLAARPGRFSAQGCVMRNDPLPELLEKLCRGDDAAAEQVFRTYEPYLRKVVRRLLPAHMRAKFDSIDVVQSTWADLVRGFRTADWHFTSPQQLRVFLIRATRNRFIDRVRRHHTPLEREKPVPVNDLEQLSGSYLPRPSEVAEANELWE